jgi:hypothetical protein
MFRMIFSVLTDFLPLRDKPVQFGVSIPLIHKQLFINRLDMASQNSLLPISPWLSKRWKRVTQQILTAVCCILLPACTGFVSNKYAAELVSPLDANAGMGLVILSVGSQESCPLVIFSTFLAIYPDSDSLFRSDAVTLYVNSRLMDSEFRDHHGHLYVLKLPSGGYYLTPSPAGRYQPRGYFTVDANETTYLGEFYMANQCYQRARFLLRDQESRDRAMLLMKNPAFKDVRVTKRLVTLFECFRC